MKDHQPLIERIEALVDRNFRPDWEDVVRRAEAPGREERVAHTRRSRRSYLTRRLVPVFVLAAAAFAFVLIAPWQHDRSLTDSAVAERALIAIGDGPVLHVVLSRETAWSYIDLASGRERPATSTEEIWFDSERHFKRWKMSSELDPPGRRGGEVLQTPTGMWASYDIDPGKPRTPSLDPALGEFFDGYRSALASGKARITGNGAVEGREVTWIEFAGKPDCDYYACTKRVAIDETSALPLEIAAVRKGKVVDRIAVVSIETLPAGSGDFSKPKKAPEASSRFFVGRQTTPITLSAAVEEVPGALWVGESISGLQLSNVSRSDLTIRETSEPGTAQSIETAIELHYGYGSPPGLWSKAPTATKGPSEGDVVLKEAATPGADFWLFKTPPTGSMLTVGGTSSNCDGFLFMNGTYVFVHATSRELLLAAARALKPIQATVGTS